MTNEPEDDKESATTDAPETEMRDASKRMEVVIHGKPVVGETLTAEVNIAEKERHINYQWYREIGSIDTEDAADIVKQPIEGATELQYKLRANDTGSRILVAATQKDTDGKEYSAFSDPTEEVMPREATVAYGSGSGGADEEKDCCNLWWLLLLLIALACGRIAWNARKKKNKHDA